MTRLAQRRRQRTIAAFCAGLVGVLLLPVLGFLSVDALRSSREGRNALAKLPPLIQIPTTPGAMLAVADSEGEISSVVVLALRPASADGIARGGTIIVVPAGVRTPIEGGGNVRLADTFNTGGMEGLLDAVESALSVSLVRGDVVTATQLAALLAPLGSVTVDLDLPLVVDGVEIVPAGQGSLDSTTLARALATPLEGEELARIATVRGLWSAVASAAGRVASPGNVDPTVSIEDFTRALFSGPVGAYPLSAQAVTDPAENPDAVDMVNINPAEATLVTATVLPGSVSPPNASVTFYVRSPLSDPRATLDAVARLLFLQANVVLVKEDDRAIIPARNTISFFDAATEDEARRFVEQLGPYDVVPVDQRIDGVDVILTLGSEFLVTLETARQNAAAATPSTVSASPVNKTTDTVVDGESVVPITTEGG